MVFVGPFGSKLFSVLGGRKRPSRKPDRGIVRIGLTTLNQNDETILSLALNALVAHRPHE